MLFYEELTKAIIGRSFDVMNELGAGFLESVYPSCFKNWNFLCWVCLPGDSLEIEIILGKLLRSKARPIEECMSRFNNAELVKWSNNLRRPSRRLCLED